MNKKYTTCPNLSQPVPNLSRGQDLMTCPTCPLLLRGGQEDRLRRLENRAVPKNKRQQSGDRSEAVQVGLRVLHRGQVTWINKPMTEPNARERNLAAGFEWTADHRQDRLAELLAAYREELRAIAAKVSAYRTKRGV